MFNTDKENLEALQSLVGNLEWICCGNALHSDLKVIFRVNGELRGLSIKKEELAGYPRDRFPVYRMRIIPLPRASVLACATWIERRSIDKISLLSPEEQIEWVAICEADKKEQADRDAKRQADQDEQDRREYERLKAKFSPGENS